MAGGCKGWTGGRVRLVEADRELDAHAGHLGGKVPEDVWIAEDEGSASGRRHDESKGVKDAQGTAMTSMSLPGPIPPMTRLLLGTWSRRSSEPFASAPSCRQTRQCSPPDMSTESRS